MGKFKSIFSENGHLDGQRPVLEGFDGEPASHAYTDVTNALNCPGSCRLVNQSLLLPRIVFESRQEGESALFSANHELAPSLIPKGLAPRQPLVCSHVYTINRMGRKDS